MSNGTLPTPSNAESLDERLVAYLDNELSDDERRSVDEFLASNDAARDRLRTLMRTWEMLGDLNRQPVDDSFLRSTLEMVVVEARDEAEKTQAAAVVRRRRRWALGTFALAAVAAAGYWATVVFWPDPNRQLLEDLPVLESLDEYRNAGDIEFLRLLEKEGLFDGGQHPIGEAKP